LTGETDLSTPVRMPCMKPDADSHARMHRHTFSSHCAYVHSLRRPEGWLGCPLMNGECGCHRTTGLAACTCAGAECLTGEMDMSTPVRRPCTKTCADSHARVHRLTFSSHGAYVHAVRPPEGWHSCLRTYGACGCRSTTGLPACTCAGPECLIGESDVSTPVRMRCTKPDVDSHARMHRHSF